MDQPQYTKVMPVVAGIPDPRMPRGKQLEWSFIWGLILTALLSQQRSPTAIAQWAHRHAAPLLTAFAPARGRLPSESTIRRALQRVEVAALERQLAALDAPRRPHSKGKPSMASLSGAPGHMALPPCSSAW